MQPKPSTLPNSTSALPGSGRFEALDSLRGICALLVCLLHIKSTGILHNNAFVQESWLFVDFFFVLSGFVIAASYADKLSAGFGAIRYMGLRLGRLYPLHLAIVALFVVLQLLILIGQQAGIAAFADQDAFTGRFSISLLIKQLTFTNVILYEGEIGWNNPSWSISAEFWTYAIAAVVFVCLPGRRLAAPCAIAALSLLLLATTNQGNLLRIDEFAIVRCCYGFFLGVIVLRLYRMGEARFQTAPATLPQIAIIIAIIGFVAAVGKGPATLLAPVLFSAAIFAFASDRGMLGTMLCRPFPRLLGRLSYGIYMVHMFVITVMLQGVSAVQALTGWSLLETGSGGKLFGTGEISGGLWIVSILALIIVAAHALNRLVEEPARLWSRALLGTRANVVRTAPA